MCSTSKMIVLFFILLIIQSNSAYRNEPFVFVKPCNQELNSYSVKADIYNRNKRHKLEQIRARHENKLTVNTEKNDLGADMNKILLDNKDAEIFHNKNTNVKRSATFKSKVNKNTYQKIGYNYANEEEDSNKENVDSMPKSRHENKHPFEKLILNKIKADNVPLSKRKDYRKNGIRDNKQLRVKTSNLKHNAEFIPSSIEVQKYQADLNKAEVDISTTFPIISNDDYLGDGPNETEEEEPSETSSVTTTECVTENVDINNIENMTDSTINKNETTLPVNMTTKYKRNTTEYTTTTTTTTTKSNTEVHNKVSDKNNSIPNSSKMNSVPASSKNTSTSDPNKSSLTFDSSKNSTTVDDANTKSSTLTTGTKNDSATICFDITDSPFTTCEVCVTLFPVFGTEPYENNDSNSTSGSNSTSTSVSLTSNTNSTSGTTTAVSLATKSTTTSNNKSSSVLTTQDINHNIKSQKLTKRNLSVFEYNLFESIDSAVTDGNNLMQDTTSTTCLTESSQFKTTTERNLRTEVVSEENLQPAIITEGNLWLNVVTKENFQTERPTEVNLWSEITSEGNVLSKETTKMNFQSEGEITSNFQSGGETKYNFQSGGVTKETLWSEIISEGNFFSAVTTKENLKIEVGSEAKILSSVTDTTTSCRTTEGDVPNKTELAIESTTALCMTVFKYTVPQPENRKILPPVVITLPQTETIPIIPTPLVTNLMPTAKPVDNISSTQQEKPTFNISSIRKEGFEASTSRMSTSFTNNLTFQSDIPKTDHVNGSNLTVNVSLQLSQTVSSSVLPNGNYIVTPIINYTYPLTQIVHEYVKLPVSTVHNVTTESATSMAQPVSVPLSTVHNVTTECVTTGMPQPVSVPLSTVHNVTTECVTTGMPQPVSIPLQQSVSSNMTSATVSGALNMTQSETMITKHGFNVKLPHVNLPFFNKSQSELPLCTNATEKFTVFPLKINTTVSKLAVYTFHKPIHSVTKCVYASEVTKKFQKTKLPHSSLELIKPETTPSGRTKPSMEVPPPTLQQVMLQTATKETQNSTVSWMTVFKYTIPSVGPVHTVKPPAPIFQQSIPPSIPNIAVTTEPSIVVPSLTIQQSVTGMISNKSETTSSRTTVFRNSIQPPEYGNTILAQSPAVQKLTPQTVPPNNVKLLFPPSEPTTKKLVPEPTPNATVKPTTLAPLQSIEQNLKKEQDIILVPRPQTTTDRVQSTTGTCMTVFKYTVPPAHRVKVPVPVAQQKTVLPLTPISNRQETIPQKTLPVEDKSRPMLTQTTPKMLSPIIHRTECIPVPVVAGHAKGNKIYPIRHKGGDPGNYYYKKQPAVAKRFSKRPLLCTTIKFVECTTQYQPIIQTVLQNTEKVFIPKVIATKTETQTCKPDSSDCSSCDFGNALPEMLPNKVELPPNPMPPVNLDFPKGNNDTSCVDINQILNFTSAP